jgi:hypothetical protein
MLKQKSVEGRGKGLGRGSALEGQLTRFAVLCRASLV